MRIAITGITSFTGAEIARTLSNAGHEVHGLCSAPPDSYAGLKSSRLRSLTGVRLHGGLIAENGDHARWIRAHRPDFWIHHHHSMENFRLDSYDAARARAVSLDPLESWVGALEECGARAIVHTGSYFEPGEGGHPPESPATPYARSKREVWRALEERLERSPLRLAKVVVPNPFGPRENADRLIPTLLQRARDGTAIDLWTPSARADQIPVQTLGQAYAHVLSRLANERRVIARPSGLVIDNASWVRRVCDALLVKRLGLAYPEVRVHTGEDEKPSRSYQNPESERVAIDWENVWDQYAEVILRTTDDENRR